MTDTKLSALATGTTPTYFYGSEAGASKKYNGTGILNVKDFGANGDGATDDTSAIQAAFDAAFGSNASPNGNSYWLNKPVYFPAGRYIVNSPASTKTVSGAANNGSGKVRLTVNNITGLSVGSRVSVESIVGTTEANGGHTITATPDSTHIDLDINFSNGYSSGGTVSSPALWLNNVEGAWIFGAGRNAVTITNNTSGGITLATDGFQYSKISGLTFTGSGAGSHCLLLNHFTTGRKSVQSVLVENCGFGTATRGATLASGPDDTGSYGQGSEITFLQCQFQTLSVYAIAARNANALQISVIGGNIADGAIGIHCDYGAINVIQGVGFQLQTDCDIKVSNQAANTMSVIGCRTESSNFITNDAGQSMQISACNQYGGGTRGYFYQGNTGGGVIHISGCYFRGQVKAREWTQLCIQACKAFDEASAGDWLVKEPATWRKGVANGGADPQLFIEIENVISETVGNAFTSINKQRIYTTDQSTVTTKNYTVA